MAALRWLVAITLISSVAVACGDGSDVGTIDGSTTMVLAEAAPLTTGSPTTSVGGASTTSSPTVPPTTAFTPPAVIPPTTTTSSGGAELPGEPTPMHARKGAVLAVVGVAHDDVLNVRELPGMTAIVTTLAPTAADVVSEGEGRLLPGSIWWKVTANGRTGWVNSRFVAYLGSVGDLTFSVVDRHGGYPTGPTMEALGRTVAETLTSEDPPSTIVMSVAPTVGDLGEVTYDVVGIGDDAQAGWRLHVFGAPDGNGFRLKSVEATALCSRGLGGEVCV